VFFGRLRLNRRKHQPLVRFAQIDVEPLNLQPGLNRLFPDPNGLLAQPDRIFSGRNRRFTSPQRLLCRVHCVFAVRWILHNALR
jgi:hypothetical protein